MKFLAKLSLFVLILSACAPLSSPKPESLLTFDSNDHQDSAYYLTWSPDAKLLAVTTFTGVYVYDTNTFEQMAIFAELSGSVVTFSKEYMAAINGNTIRVWGLKDYKLLFQEKENNDIQFQSVSISPDGKWLVTGEQKQFRLWNLLDGKVVETFPMDGFVSNLAFTDHNTLIVIEQYKAETQEWDLQNSKMIRSFEIPRDVLFFTLSQDGKTMLVDYGESGVELWNVEIGQAEHYYRQMQGASGWTQLSGNNQFAAVWGYAIDGNQSGMSVWSLVEDKQLWEFSTPFVNGDGWRCGALNSDGSVLAASNNEGYIYFYDMKSGEKIGEIFIPYKFAT